MPDAALSLRPYEEADEPVKRIEQSRIEEVGAIPVHHRVVVSTPRKGSRTLIEVSDVRFNQGLGDDLFSQRAVRRLAALRHMARERATVNNINLLRHFISWEPRRLLRNHARAIVQRMEREVRGVDAISNGGAGARTA